MWRNLHTVGYRLLERGYLRQDMAWHGMACMYVCILLIPEPYMDLLLTTPNRMLVAGLLRITASEAVLHTLPANAQHEPM